MATAAMQMPIKPPRYRVTVDLTLAKGRPHEIAFLHSLIERKLADGDEVIGFTIVDIMQHMDSAAHAGEGVRGPSAPEGALKAAAGAGESGDSLPAPKRFGGTSSDAVKPKGGSQK